MTFPSPRVDGYGDYATVALLFRFEGHLTARNSFLASGIGLGIVYMVANYKAADPYRRDRAARRDVTAGAY